MEKIWTEKYRPSTFDEMKGQDEIINRVRAFIEKKNMPHLLFAGPPGVGKSSLAIVIAKQLFGEEWRLNLLELNASDERGIDVVRNKVKDFARTRAIGDVPFKIILLDESDALTKDAQNALRRTMENYTQTTRFILSCVTPDTKILLPGEREITIGEFLDQYERNNNKEVKVQNITQDRNSTKKDLVLAGVKLPASSIGKKVLHITTISGRELKVTEDHKLLTRKGWKEAGTLTKQDQLLIYPNLEDTHVENNAKKIIDLKKFIEFLSKTEEMDGMKKLEDASRFRNLKTEDKNRIIIRIEELKAKLKQENGITKREFEVYSLIKDNPEISRQKLQENLNITRMGINYLLPSLENKALIKRRKDNKIHKFSITNIQPIILRNYMDVKKIIEEEFNIKISYSAIIKSNNKDIFRGRVDRTIGELKRKEIIDISYNDIDKIGALARICGFMLGDGHLVRNNIRLHFSGNKDALTEVQKDLEVLGYNNYSKIISVKLENTIRGRKFQGTSTSFSLDSRAFSLLLQYLEIPKGDKTITSYNVPEFIRKGTKFVKREFLRALFGCDGDKPNYKNMNFGALSLRQNKAQSLKDNMLDYYGEISELFRVFEIDTYTKIRDKGEIRNKDNTAVLTFDLIVRPNNKNLFKYFSRIGYAYEKYKMELSRQSAEYLRQKLNLIRVWEEKSKIAVARINSGSGIFEVARELEISPDFVTNQIKGKDVHLPRKIFVDFNIWRERYKFNELLLINDIQAIKEIDEDIVMDITCHKDHNFITNGIISHNCNYSSKITDPIQSRCTVFKFKPLPKEDIFKIIDKIAVQESLQLDDKAKEALYVASGGDCRKMENILQSCACFSNIVSDESVYQIASAARPQEVKEVIELAVKGDFLEARKLLLKTMLHYGLSGLDIIKQIQKTVWDVKVDDKKKMDMIESCGDIEFRIVEGSDDFVQLEALLARFGKK